MIRFLAENAIGFIRVSKFVQESLIIDKSDLKFNFLNLDLRLDLIKQKNI